MKTSSFKILSMSLFIVSASFTTFSQVNTFPSNGNVGIGTTNPETLLNINVGAGGTNGAVGLRIGGTGNYSSLEFGIDGYYDGMIKTYGNDLKYFAGHWKTFGSVSSENHSHLWYTSKLGSSNWSTPKMILNHEGNLGIGTTNPTGKLEIKGPYDGNSQLIINTTSANAELRFSYNDQIKGFVWFDPNLETLGFGKGSINNSFFVNSAGNFGVGTIYPAYKLDVIGTIRSREVKVDMNGADFVFEKDYKLMSLNELEKYLKKEKHLPEIAPAKEMEANGTDLGALNSKLLQKVEELTLYLIEQNKKVDELKEIVTTQNQKILKLESKLK